jgi:hypothetical protein
MGFDKTSVSVSLTTAGAQAGFHLTTPAHVYGHLTKGFSVVNDTAVMAHAWSAVATLNWDSQSTGGAEFGFIQFQENVGAGFDYVGATPADGSVRLLVTEPPAMTQKLALDSRDKAGCKPFTLGQPGRSDFNHPVVTIHTGDHPAVKVPKVLGNAATNKPNYLRSIFDKRKFWTVLAIKDGESYTYLKHFTWAVTFEATFKWAGGAVKIEKSTSPGVSFDAVKNGPPVSQSLTALLQSPKGPMSNELMDAALTSAAKKGGHKTNREDFPDGTCGGRISTLPADFFT